MTDSTLPPSEAEIARLIATNIEVSDATLEAANGVASIVGIDKAAKAITDAILSLNPVGADATNEVENEKPSMVYESDDCRSTVASVRVRRSGASSSFVEVAEVPVSDAGAVAMREALEFYANPDNWIDTPSWDGDPSCITPKAIPVTSEDGRPCDCGDRARSALSSLPVPAKRVEDGPTHTCKRAGGFVDSNCLAMCDCHVTMKINPVSSLIDIRGDDVQRRCVQPESTTHRESDTKSGVRSRASGIFVDPRDGLMIRFEDNRHRKATTSERALMLSALQGVSCELSDEIRIPLHELSADVDYLIGRVIADSSCAAMIASSIKGKLAAVENAVKQSLQVAK
jgi:hypothetical protein